MVTAVEPVYTARVHRVFPLRFSYRAGAIFFPPGKAANVLRGALGVIFRRTACAPECKAVRTCEIRRSCPYARVFEPASDGDGPSGLADSPRPFVFRARHLDGCTIQAGQPFHFDLHVFALDPVVLAYFVLTFAALAREGLGPRRGKADLQCVRRIAVGSFPEQVLYEGSVQMMADSVAAASLDLDPIASAPISYSVGSCRRRVKHEQHVTNRPEFPILFRRIATGSARCKALWARPLR
jgi:hypothetical protein